MRLTPEQIRAVFTEHADDENWVGHAIRAALEELDWHRNPDDKAKSPYSIAKLTEGLPHRDRIIDLAISEAVLFRGREVTMQRALGQPERDTLFARHAKKVASEIIAEELNKAKKPSANHEGVRKPGFLKRLWFLITKRI